MKHRLFATVFLLASMLNIGLPAYASGNVEMSHALKQENLPLKLVLIPDLPTDQVDEIQLLETARVVLRRLQALGVAQPVVQVVHAYQTTLQDNETEIQTETFQIIVQIEGIDPANLSTLIPAITRLGLLEFVDFSMVSAGQILEGSCILTTEQVTLAEARLLPGETPKPYDQYTCTSMDANNPKPDQALLNNGQPYRTIMTGAGLADAAAVMQGRFTSQWAVNFVLKKGAERVEDFIDYVASNPTRPMAIVLDGRLISYPTIQPSLSDSARAGTMDGGLITGNFTADQVHTLAAQLTSGTLTIPLCVESTDEAGKCA
jgi:preprotein translocase subunit SecD